ncbi:lipopolysaccharide biosynthesis protein [Flavihumibacter sp. R14]|nr:lipopolysaccharide biosynthesis protein [Flavihumibacter soli]
MKELASGTFQRLKKAKILANFVNLSSIQLSNALLLILLYPLITRIVGLEAFGLVMLANAFAGLLGIVVNFGTSQSGIKDVAVHKDDPQNLSRVFYNTLLIRFLIFLLFMVFFTLAGLGNFVHYEYYLFAVPLILAEVVNPLFLYLGTERLAVYSMANLVGKVLIILSVIFLINGSSDALWVNFLIGGVNSLIYIFLIIRGVMKYQLPFILPSKADMLELSKSNFFLVGNNISVHLQQSLMLFALARWGNPMWLGAYSLCDKITWSSRLMISSIANSVYPKAAWLFSEDPLQFIGFKNRIKKVLTLAFLVISACMMIFAAPIIYLVAGEPNATAETVLRIMSLVPAAAALNSLNVLELLIRENNRSIFNIAMVLLVLAFTLAFGISILKNIYLLGAYTLFIELSAIMMYEYVIRKEYPVYA